MDKDNTYIDSEFVDHSWQEMSKLLDRDMPVKKRKRRLLWPFFFGIGLLGLIGIAYSMNDKEPILKSFTVQKEVSVVTNESPPIHNSQLSINSKKDFIKQPSTKSSDDIRAISTNKHPAVAKTLVAVGIGISKTKNNVKKQFPIQKTTNQDLLIGKNKIEKIELVNKWQTAFSFIPQLPINELKHNQSRGLTLPLIQKKQAKWRFGFYAGTLGPKFGSFRTGLFTNARLNKKWSLQFGLGYSRRIPTSITNEAEDLSSPLADVFTEEMEMEDLNPAAGTFIDTSGNNTSTEIDLMENSTRSYTNFYYFELPIIVQYQVRPKLAIEVGGNLSYLSKDVNAITIFDNSHSNLSLTNLSSIPTINLSLIGGVNYQINKKINVYTNYHYSGYYLKSTPISTFSEKRWQQIEVGIRYFFK